MTSHLPLDEIGLMPVAKTGNLIHTIMPTSLDKPSIIAPRAPRARDAVDRSSPHIAALVALLVQVTATSFIFKLSTASISMFRVFTSSLYTSTESIVMAPPAPPGPG